MTLKTKCPNCGAQNASNIKDSPNLCQYCGSTLEVLETKQLTSEEVEGLGYTPDPPAVYSPPVDTDKSDEPKLLQTVLINGKPVEISPDIVSKVIHTGRNISRYFVLAIALIITLCSLCFMLGLFQN